jgi:signal transduction histidine kinase
MASRLATTEQTRRRLLTDLAHELRTPLASIEATIEAMADGILPIDQSTLETLTEQSQRLHQLVGDLSAVSRAEERQLNLDPVLVPLQGVVSAAVTEVRPRFEAKGITLIEDGVSTWQVLADPDRLAEALGALLDNGLRHTPLKAAPSSSPPPVRTTGAGSWCPIPAKGSTLRWHAVVRALLPG